MRMIRRLSTKNMITCFRILRLQNFVALVGMGG